MYGVEVFGAWFEFRDGYVVDAGATEGAEVLRRFLDSAPESRYAGEVALVGSDSPIFESGLTFGDILLDENAACHLALGAAYPSCISGGERMSESQLNDAGLNVGSVHIDFMFGSEDTRVEAICHDGSRLPVLVGGRFRD